MSFKFYPKQSKLYDFLHFPRLLFYMEERKISKEFDYYKEIKMDQYLDFIKNVEYTLKPFKDDIEMFYTLEFSDGYNFIDLISKNYSIFDYDDEKKYLNMLSNLNQHEINKSIIYAIMLEEDENILGSEDYHKQKMDEAEQICSDKDKIISFIKGLSINAGAKWKLFLIVEDPIKYMKMYINLMTKLLPIFEDIYLPYQEQINIYGNQLAHYLNQNGIKGLEKISHSIFDAKIIDEEEDIEILISVVFSYKAALILYKKNYLIWGLKMEEAFKQIKEIHENKKNERIQIFKYLGDKTRYEVLKLIASGETSTKKIAKLLGVSSATISYHTNNFIKSKVIKIDKKNNKFGYIIDYKLLNDTIKDLKNDLNFPEEFK